MIQARHILITGATGLVGNKLVPLLSTSGHSITTVGRSKHSSHGVPHLLWDDPNLINGSALIDVTDVIHLAGSNIGGKKWTNANKTEFINSRVDSAATLNTAFRNQNTKLYSFISASAIGHYGSDTTDEIRSEKDPSGSDFVAGLCEKWEASADEFSKLADRIVKLRIGVALSPEGGALEKMIGPTRLGLGSALGSGKQWFPWIHIDDLVKIIVHCIENENLAGVYNAVAPEHATNQDVNKALASAMNKPFWAPNVPSFLLKLMFGEMSEILLGGSRVSSQKILDTGFSFDHPELKTALKDLVGND